MVYIDTSTVVENSLPAADLSSRLKQDFDISLQVHQLEEVFETSTSSLDRSTTNLLLHAASSSSSPAENLQALLEPLSPTSRASLIAALRLLLLTKIAKDLNLALIMTAETSTDLAVKTLSGIAQGRGWAVGEDVAAVHRLDSGWSCEAGRCAARLKQCYNRSGSTQTVGRLDRG